MLSLMTLLVLVYMHVRASHAYTLKPNADNSHLKSIQFLCDFFFFFIFYVQSLTLYFTQLQ